MNKKLIWWIAVIGLLCVIALTYKSVLSTRKGGNETTDLGLITTVNVTGGDKDEVGRRQEQRRIELAHKKLMADLEVRIAKYNGDVEAIAEKYRKMLPLSKAEDDLKKCQEGVEFIASREGLCGWKVCVSLAYKMAYDKVKGTHHTEEAIDPLVDERIIPPVKSAIERYAEWTKNMGREMTVERQALAADLAVRFQSFNQEIIVISDHEAKAISRSVDNLIAQIENHAEEAAYAAVGVAFEAVMIRSSYLAIKSCIKGVVRVGLSLVVKRIGTTAVTAAGSAIADGPLPIGDIIATTITVGGLAWTAWDVYKVTKIMPKEMREGMEVEIGKVREDLLGMAEDNLEKFKKANLDFAEKKRSEVAELIK